MICRSYCRSTWVCAIQCMYEYSESCVHIFGIHSKQFKVSDTIKGVSCLRMQPRLERCPIEGMAVVCR